MNKELRWISLKLQSPYVYNYGPAVCLYNDEVSLPMGSAFKLSALVRPDEPEGFDSVSMELSTSCRACIHCVTNGVFQAMVFH